MFTVATHSERWFPAFQESCRRNRLPLTVLGWGERWRGFSWRFDLYKAALAQCDPSELVMVTDAFDAVFLAGPEEIEQKFRAFNSPIVFTAEPQASDLMEWVKGTVWNRYKNRIVNGGTYLGYAGDLLKLMNSLHYKNDTDDQKLLTAHCAIIGAIVDWNGDICLHWTTWAPSTAMKTAYVSNGRLWSCPHPEKEPKQFACPIMLTSPGGGNGPLQVVRELGFDETLAPYVSSKFVLAKVPQVVWEARKPLAGLAGALTSTLALAYGLLALLLS